MRSISRPGIPYASASPGRCAETTLKTSASVPASEGPVSACWKARHPLRPNVLLLRSSAHHRLHSGCLPSSPLPFGSSYSEATNSSPCTPFSYRYGSPIAAPGSFIHDATRVHGRILSLRPLPVVRDSEIQGIPRTKRCWRSCRSSTLPRTNARCCFALSPLTRSPEQASATPANTLPQSPGSVLPVASRSQCQDAPHLARDLNCACVSQFGNARSTRAGCHKRIMVLVR